MNCDTRETVRRPMLAATLTWEQAQEADVGRLSGEFLVSAKLDGIRCLVQPNLGPVTRKLKLIPNKHIRETLWADYMRDLEGFDGELVAPAWVATKMGKTVYNATQSIVMSGKHPYEREIQYWVFDDFSTPLQAFLSRTLQARDRIRAIQQLVNGVNIGGTDLHYLRHVTANLPKDRGWLLDLLDYEIANGAEGLVLRRAHGTYKYGRSTLLEGGMVKFKGKWEDNEGVIIDFEELMRNKNELEKDELGYAKRSTAKGGKVPGGTLGKLVLDTIEWGPLRVGSGIDDALREEIWKNPDVYRGRIACFKYQYTDGAEKPRFTIFKGFRKD